MKTIVMGFVLAWLTVFAAGCAGDSPTSVTVVTDSEVETTDDNSNNKNEKGE